MITQEDIDEFHPTKSHGFHITEASGMGAKGRLTAEDEARDFTSFDTAFDFGREHAERIYVHDDNGRICKRYVVKDFHDQLVDATHALKEWLGEEGIAHFQGLYDLDDCLPISIHLQQGMQVRNFLRRFPGCSDWNCPAYEFFDYIYMEVICRAVDRPVNIQTVIYKKK